MLKKTAILMFVGYLLLGFELVLPAVTNASDITGSITSGVSGSGAGNAEGVVKSAPVALPVAGDYHANQSTTLTASGSTAICYTADGTTPACSTSVTCAVGSTKYVSAISVTSSATIKSVGCYGDNTQGPAGSVAYTLTCTTPTVTNGTVSAYPTCALTCNSGYTVSGSTCISSGGGGPVSGGGGGGGSSVSYVPTSASIVINNYASTTNSTSIVLALSASNMSSSYSPQMMISNDVTFVGAVWETYATSKAWTLPDNEGFRTVYVKFKNVYGTSDFVSDSVVYNKGTVSTTPTTTITTPTTTTTTTTQPSTTGGTATPSKSISEMTPVELQAEIVRLVNILTVLQAQYSAQQSALGITPSGQTYTFTSNMEFGAVGNSVKNLQKVLNSDPDTVVALSGVGSKGRETTMFGYATKAAVMKFQKKYGIYPIAGYVGAKTRAKLNTIIVD